MSDEEVKRLENGLKWIKHIAWLHAIGQAFDPHHMNALSDLAADLLGGKELADYDDVKKEAMEKATQRLAEMEGYID